MSDTGGQFTQRSQLAVAHRLCLPGDCLGDVLHDCNDVDDPVRVINDREDTHGQDPAIF